MECSFNSCSQAFAPVFQAVADGANWTIDKVSMTVLKIFNALSAAAIWTYTHGANAIQGVVSFFAENQDIVIPVALGIGVIAFVALGIVVAKNFSSCKAEGVNESDDEASVGEIDDEEEPIREIGSDHEVKAEDIHADLERLEAPSRERARLLEEIDEATG